MFLVLMIEYLCVALGSIYSTENINFIFIKKRQETFSYAFPIIPNHLGQPLKYLKLPAQTRCNFIGSLESREFGIWNLGTDTGNAKSEET